MKPTLVALLVVVGLSAWRADLGACGDKSLSAGGIRQQRAIAVLYPANVLIYEQPTSRVAAAARELKLQQTLQQVGHKYRVVTSSADVDAAIATGQFNVVMTDYADLANMQQRVKSSLARVVVVPVAYNLTKSEKTEASKQCQFLVKAPSQAAEYLSTIAQAVRAGGNSQLR